MCRLLCIAFALALMWSSITLALPPQIQSKPKPVIWDANGGRSVNTNADDSFYQGNGNFFHQGDGTGLRQGIDDATFRVDESATQRSDEDGNDRLLQ